MSSSSKLDSGAMDFFGIPVYVSPYVREGEVLLIQEGHKIELHVHEGPQAGETVEQWLTPMTVRRITLDPFTMSLPVEFPMDWKMKRPGQ